MSGIDLNRGVQINTHPSGVKIFMYIGNPPLHEDAEPGVYRNAHGGEVSEDMAEAAGFPVEALRIMKLKKEKQAQVLKALDTEFAAMGTVRQVLEEIEGYKLVHIGLGRHVIESPQGEQLTPRPLTEDEATKVFLQVVPPAPKD